LYIYHRARRFFNLTTSLTSPPGDISPLLSVITSSWNFDTLNQMIETLVQNFTTQISSAGQLLDVAIDTIIAMAKDLVLFLLQGAEAIALAVLSAVPSAANGLSTTLQGNIRIPIISWLYKYVITSPSPPFVAGEDLTVLDLLCLAFAVPVTILYKVLRGGA